ncbi:Hsp70 family protein [Nannocystis sp. SCPEA4]|uniref:Hsp70 family protein n=1 Tax=Nannocystis sp. SCPEA4 TaxID=2996787 RepID=UPI00226E264F|nr:Hsp70 family protein [Nannocystis sp. SCPEA4]MCY1061308.1 Hsp70 family protein [Nannocystis sp. SCPEA4]
MSTAIGIDLGTTRCTVGIFEHGRASALLQGKGVMVLPAAVAIDAEGGVVVGDRARRMALLRPDTSQLYVHRLLGRRFEAVTPGVWQPQALVRAEHGDASVKLGEHSLLPQALVAAQVAEVRAIAEEQLGEAVTHAVVTVPVYFGDAQRRALLHACRLGGLEVRRLVHPTTAAALLYQAERTGVDDEVIVLVDAGAGGVSCAVVEIKEREVAVLAQRGLALGGEDIDGRVVEWLMSERGDESGDADLVRSRIRDAAEKAKIALSERKDVEINLPFLSADEAGPKHLAAKLTQARLEKLAGDVVQRIAGLVAKVFEESGVPLERIGDIMLIGGTSRIPALHERVEAIFKKIPSSKLDAVDTVARGAAILAGLLASRHPEVRVLEAMVRPLLVKLSGGEVQTLLTARAAVPAETAVVLNTPGDGRASPEARLYQGERGADEDDLLASFVVTGRPEVEVKLRVDDNQVLDLSVRELLRGKEARLHVRERGGIGEEQLTAMVEAARARETEARAEREAHERRTRLEGMVQRCERILGEQDKLAPEVRTTVEAGLRDARAVLTSGDAELVRTAIDGLAAVLQPLGGEWAAIAAPPPPRARLQPVVAPPPARVRADAANALEEVGEVVEDDDE